MFFKHTSSDLKLNRTEYLLQDVIFIIIPLLVRSEPQSIHFVIVAINCEQSLVVSFLLFLSIFMFVKIGFLKILETSFFSFQKKEYLILFIDRCAYIPGNRACTINVTDNFQMGVRLT